MEAAERAGFPEQARHLEYFSVPELPEYSIHEFTLKLTPSGRQYNVSADRSAAEVLNENGMHVDVQRSDGVCGVCKCTLTAGEVEHRDVVLSRAQRETSIILCQSRALREDGVVELNF